MKRFVTLTAFILSAVWGLYTGSRSPMNYERLVWGGLAAWVCLVWCWCLVPTSVRKRQDGDSRPLARFIGLVLSVAPGLILGCYGWFAPAAPSYANGGMDVCDLEPGFCVSGTRAFIFFGGFTFVCGLIANWVINLKSPPPR